jgi:hypothetical protein
MVNFQINSIYSHKSFPKPSYSPRKPNPYPEYHIPWIEGVRVRFLPYALNGEERTAVPNP